MVSLKEMAKDSRQRNLPKATKEPPQKSAKLELKSSEFVQESEDEIPSASDSDSDHESIDLKQGNSISETSSRLSAPNGSSSESGSESDQETTSSEEEEEEEGSINITNKTSILPVPQENLAPEPIVKSITSQKRTPYKAPSGFAIEAPGDDLAVSEILSKRNLEGKHLWYFTAPASIDISAIEEVSLLDIKEGKSVLKLNGDEFQFIVETTSNQTSTNIMVPNALDKGYQITSKPIDQILHLQQKVNLPGMNGLNFVESSLIRKVPRPQPNGLRMRFHPLGFDTEAPETIGSGSSSIDEASGASDIETETASKTFKGPRYPGSSGATVDSSPKVNEISSDEERNDIPIVPPKFTQKIGTKNHGKPKSSGHASQSSKKRKHEEKEGKMLKKSLSSPTNDIGRELKRTKRK